MVQLADRSRGAFAEGSGDLAARRAGRSRCVLAPRRPARRARVPGERRVYSLPLPKRREEWHCFAAATARNCCATEPALRWCRSAAM